MSILNQLPGTLNINVSYLNNINISFNFGFDISTYTFSSLIQNSTEVFTFTEIDYTAGTVSAKIAKGNTFERKKYDYEIYWDVGTIKRTVIKGYINVN